jgi:hypothetical protein
MPYIISTKGSVIINECGENYSYSCPDYPLGFWEIFVNRDGF